MDSSDGRGPRVLLLLRELALVSKLAAPYGRDPSRESRGIAEDRLDALAVGELERQRAGYANGRFAMDINAIWVPRALESISGIIGALKTIGLSEAEMTRAGNSIAGTELHEFVSDPARLQQAIDNWNHALSTLSFLSRQTRFARRCKKSFNRCLRRSASIGRVFSAEPELIGSHSNSRPLTRC
jgi:hypothetical protein